MKERFRQIIKVLSWMSVLGCLFAGLNFIVQPVWLDWNNYDTVHGFYEEPEDTIEVVFLGTSSVVNSITPMELYENYGICAYNLGTEQQPMMASFYWLEEAYRKHPQTLKTVVLEASALRFTQQLAFDRKAFDGMEWSSVKYNAMTDYAGKTGDTMANLLPVYTYHDRWKNLGQTDFEKVHYSPNICVRGYNFSTDRYLDSNDTLQPPLYFVDDDAARITLNAEAEEYFERIVSFCDEHGLNLVLFKVASWQASEHNAVKALAELHGVEFLDLTFEPLFSETAVNMATDAEDGLHLNYYGARKITAYIGNYLKTNYQIRDVREDTKYSFMKERLDQYHTSVGDVIKRNEIVDPAEYLSMAVADKDAAVFIAVKDDAASQLTMEQRANFEGMGLSKLSVLAFRDSYLAVFDSGRLICEQIEHQRNAEEDDRESVTLSYSGELDDGSVYSLESGGIAMGNKASCLIDGTEYAQNQRGLNIVIYDNKAKKVLDSVCFDTCVSAVRDEGNLLDALSRAEQSGKGFSELSAALQKLYLYNRQCNNKRTAGYLKQDISENDLFSYLSAYWKEDYIIYLSVMDEAAGAMDEAARACLADYGLEELSELGYRDSYLGVVNGGQVVYERKDHGSEPIAMRYISHVLESGGAEAGYSHLSIIIDGTEYSPNSRGINIVVYDTMTKEVVDTAVFDTCVNPIKTLNTEDK